jgi:hypothetical protein
MEHNNNFSNIYVFLKHENEWQDKIADVVIHESRESKPACCFMSVRKWQQEYTH